MHRKFGLLSPGKLGNHNAALTRFFLFVFVCAVFSCFLTTGCEAYSFTTDAYEIFNVSTHLFACRAHEWGPGTNKSAQEFVLFVSLLNV